MSGPKCYHYEVPEDPAVVAARQEAAALAAARARGESALARLRRVAEEASGLRSRHGNAISAVSVPTPPSATASAQMLQQAERLERQAIEAEARLKEELGDARKASFVSQLATKAGVPMSADVGLDRLLAAVAARTKVAADSTVDQRPAISEECARVYGRLRSDAPEEARAKVERTFEIALAAAGESRAPLLVDRLRAAVQAANAESEARERRTIAIDDLLASLGEVGEEEGRLRDLLLDEREHGRPVEALRAEVDRARLAYQAQADAAKQEADRAQVATALEESLRELGYDVQAGFETALGSNGSALARRAGWTEHAVRVLLDPSTNELRLHVVRDEKPQLVGSDNVARERELCSDRPELEKALAAHGVELDPHELIAPGVVPVAAVALERAQFPARRAKGRNLAREQAR